MEFKSENIRKIVDFLYGVDCEVRHADNGNQIVVNVVDNDDFCSYHFEFVIYKSPFKITINDKNLNSGKMKTIKKIILA